MIRVKRAFESDCLTIRQAVTGIEKNLLRPRMIGFKRCHVPQLRLAEIFKSNRSMDPSRLSRCCRQAQEEADEPAAITVIA